MKHKKPLTILFDANPMMTGGKTGVGYFTYRLIEALAERYPDDLRLVGHYYNFLGRKQNQDGLVDAPNVSYRQTRLLPGKLFNGLRRHLHLEIPLEVLARTKADLLFFPNFIASPSLFHSPRIVTIHDLYFIEHPEHINQNNLDFLQKFVPSSIAKASLIMTVSVFTKQAVVEKFHAPDSKILAISIPAPKPALLGQEELQKTLSDIGIHKEYLLFLGTIEPRKNIPALIKAYMRLPQSLREKYSLVLAGGKGWNDAPILSEIDSAKTAGADVITTGYASDQQKSALYQGGALLVLPSLYEGFGMQLLEAMSFDLPVVASDIPVFHEVAGDAALYFDQTSPADIEEAMELVLTKPAVRAELVRKGREQNKKYSWRDVAGAVYKKLEELHG